MQFTNRKVKNWVLFILLIVLTASLIGFSDQIIVSAITSSQYNSKKNNLSSRAGNIKSQLDSVGGDYHNVASQKDTLEAQQRQVQNEITLTTNLMKETDTLISDLNTQIQFNLNEIEKYKAELYDITMEMQKQQQVSPLQSLISSNNLGEAISNIFILSSTQNKLDETKQNLETSNQNLQEDVKTQEELKEQLDATKILNENKKAELDKLISEFAGREAEYANQIAALKAEDAKLQAEADRLDREWAEAQAAAARRRQPPAGGGGTGGGGGSGGGGGYVPTPGICRFEDGGNPGIPSGYFMIPVSGSYSRGFNCLSHDAIDWSAPNGSAIVAAAPGEVVRKGYEGGGYGHFVVLKHTLSNGNRVYTLYAHMNSPSPAGGFVGKGQRIGSVGTTGNSTGYHLHFMIISQSYEATGLGCRWGASKCYNPARFL